MRIVARTDRCANAFSNPHHNSHFTIAQEKELDPSLPVRFEALYAKDSLEENTANDYNSYRYPFEEVSTSDSGNDPFLYQEALFELNSLPRDADKNEVRAAQRKVMRCRKRKLRPVTNPVMRLVGEVLVPRSHPDTIPGGHLGLREMEVRTAFNVRELGMVPVQDQIESSGESPAETKSRRRWSVSAGDKCKTSNPFKKLSKKQKSEKSAAKYASTMTLNQASASENGGKRNKATGLERKPMHASAATLPGSALQKEDMSDRLPMTLPRDDNSMTFYSSAPELGLTSRQDGFLHLFTRVPVSRNRFSPVPALLPQLQSTVRDACPLAENVDAADLPEVSGSESVQTEPVSPHTAIKEFRGEANERGVAQVRRLSRPIRRGRERL